MPHPISISPPEFEKFFALQIDHPALMWKVEMIDAKSCRLRVKDDIRYYEVKEDGLLHCVSSQKKISLDEYDCVQLWARMLIGAVRAGQVENVWGMPKRSRAEKKAAKKARAHLGQGDFHF
jgi:hypothetical protein